jgi:hypothetical protein
MQNDIRKNGKRKYRVKIMGAAASESGIGPDKLLLFNFLHERGTNIGVRKSNDNGVFEYQVIYMNAE